MSKQNKRKNRLNRTPDSGKIKRKNDSINNVLIIAGIVVITIVVFSNSFKNEFVQWDDPKYIMENPHITELSKDNVARYFSTFTDSNYLPLVLLTFSIEYQFAKMDPGLYHVNNVLLHAINTLLVFLLVYLLTQVA